MSRRPLARAAAGSGSCLAIAFAAIWLAANVLDPNGLGAFQVVCFAKDAPTQGLRMFAAPGTVRI